MMIKVCEALAGTDTTRHNTVALYIGAWGEILNGATSHPSKPASNLVSYI